MYPAAVRSTRPVDVPEGPRGVSEAASSAAAAPQTTHRLQETPGK
jgi:alpha,alpha-trehalase